MPGDKLPRQERPRACEDYAEDDPYDSEDVERQADCQENQQERAERDDDELPAQPLPDGDDKK